jgi:HTH-type transcriptional regulator/antitoxin HigA
MSDSERDTAGSIGGAVHFERLELPEPPHPGRILAAELRSRHLSQSDFAARTGLSAKHVNQVLKGTASLSADSAITVERVLGVPAHYWLRADARWQEHRVRQRQRLELGRYAPWVARFPVRELTALGYIRERASAGDVVADVLAAFRVADPAAFDRVWLAPMPGGFRRAQQFTVDEYATAAWLLIAERQTQSHDLPSFSVTGLRRALGTLRAMTRLPIIDGFLEARRLLANCGVGLTFVKELPGSRITGATWWPALHRPIIALSARHQRKDVFWFALFHEIAHLLLHARRQVFLEFTGNDDADGQETEADTFAAEELIPSAHDGPITTLPVSALPMLADTLGVGVAMVAGRRGRLTGQWAAVSHLRDQLDVDALVLAEQQAIEAR